MNRRAFIAGGLAALLTTAAIAVPASYERAIANVLVSEGGYTNDARDPGGPTNYGITIYDVRLYVKKNATAQDVRALKRDQAIAIYKSKYWDALRCGELPAGLDYTGFDYGVNSGISRFGKVLRRVLGMSDKDWHVTDEVLAAVAKREPEELIRAVNAERLRFLHGLKTWRAFGRGWGPRVASVQKISLQMASAGRGLLTVPFSRPAFGPHKAFADEQPDEVLP